MLPSSGHKSISRIDSEKNNTFGWYVRVVFRGEMHSKFFSDAKFGTEEKALAQAIRHRNRVEREMGKPRTDRSIVAAKTSSSTASAADSRPGVSRTGVSRTGVAHTGVSHTGVAGVHRITKGGHEAFQVTWSPAPNVVSRTSVSIAKYGEEDAFRRACRLRKKHELALYGKIITATPPNDAKLKTQLPNLSQAQTSKTKTSAITVSKKSSKTDTANDAATNNATATSSTRIAHRSNAKRNDAKRSEVETSAKSRSMKKGK